MISCGTSKRRPDPKSPAATGRSIESVRRPCVGYDDAVTLWIKRASSFEEEAEADVEFYRSMSPQERVDLLEQMRADWIESQNEGDEGLRRTVRRIPTE